LLERSETFIKPRQARGYDADKSAEWNAVALRPSKKKTFQRRMLMVSGKTPSTTWKRS
jgi:hypothetical protein